MAPFLSLEFQEDSIPPPPAATASGGLEAEVTSQTHGNYQVSGLLSLNAAGPLLNLSLTDVDILCQAEFCDSLTVTATFNASLLDAFPLTLLESHIDGRFEGGSPLSIAQVRVMADGVVLNAPISFDRALLLENNKDFNFPLLTIASPPAIDPAPNLGILTGTMTFKIVEGLGMDDHILLPGSLDLTITAVPEPSAGLLLLNGLCWLGLWRPMTDRRARAAADNAAEGISGRESASPGPSQWTSD